MAPEKPIALRPGKKTPSFLRRKSEKVEKVEDDSLSIRSIDTRDSRDELFSPTSFDSMPREARTITPPTKVEGIEEGMRCEVATQYRDRRGLFGYRTEVPSEEKDEEPNHVLHPDEEWLNQFAILVRKRVNPSAKGRSDFDSIRVRSPLLKPILRDLCKGYPGYGNHKGQTDFALDMFDPFTSAFHCWNDLLRLEQEHTNPETRDHIKLLQDLLEPEFKKPLKKLEECRMNGNITFNYLWAIFKPGELIYRKDINGRECVERIDDMYYCINNDCRAFKIESKMVCWDGKRFGYRLSDGWFYSFMGTTSITDLPAVPLEIHPDKAAIKTRMMKRGEKFQQLAGFHLKAYTGPEGEADYGGRGSNKVYEEALQVNDRIIISHEGAGCPRLAIDLDPLTKDSPFDDLAGDSSNRVSAPGNLRRSAATDLRKAREEWDTKAKEPKPAPRSKVMGVPTLTEDQMLTCVPHVACFDLTRKEWNLVDLGEIGDVAWNDDLFDDLIWPAEEKDLLLAVTQSYHQDGAGTFANILDKKSRGTTIMLSGPSGGGKSFAVEAVAEKLHMPLYTVSVGDMIRDFDKFEERLEDTLERCAKWNAILLVENLDFFFDKTLEGTGEGDIIAVVMHHLERHPGLVFITSTELAPLDPLLKSRFDLTLKIPAPTTEMKRQLWANTLSAAMPLRERHFSSEHLDALAQKNLSGREIKSVVKMAGMLASSKGASLKMEHIETVLKLKNGKDEKKAGFDFGLDEIESKGQENEKSTDDAKEKGKGNDDGFGDWGAWGAKAKA